MRKVAGSAGVEQRRHSGSVQRPQAIPRPRRPCPDPVEEPLLLGWDPWDSPTVGTWTSLSTNRLFRHSSLCVGFRYGNQTFLVLLPLPPRPLSSSVETCGFSGAFHPLLS